MAFVHGKQTVFKLDDLSPALIDISALVTKSKYDAKTDRPETQTFGDLGKRHAVTGLRELTISIDGFLQPTTALKLHGKSARVMLDQFALSGYLNKTQIKRKMDLPDTQTFGNAWKRRQVLGLMSADVSFSGNFDSTAGGVDSTFRAALAVDPPGFSIIDIAPNGFAIGQLVDMFSAVQGQYSINSDENQGPVPVDGSFMSDGQFDCGVALHDLTPETAALNFSSVDEAVATANGGVGHLHVSAVSGTTPNATIKIQHSVDNSAWSDLITFTAVTAVTSQRVELSAGTTVNRYVRGIISAFTGTTPSATFTMSFARRSYVSATVAPGGTHRCFAGLLLNPNTSTYEYGPEGGTTGKRRFTGECRVSDYSISIDENGVPTYSATLVSDDVVTENTFP